MQKTKIEYLGFTWNPIAMRCTPVSSGCDHCWHLRMARRHSSNTTLCREALDAYSGCNKWLHTKELSAPMKRKKPARIGVQFMGDLFHESIPSEWIAAVFDVMAASPQHTFYVLTKRSSLMFDWFNEDCDPIDLSLDTIWPLPNVCLGVSVEDQDNIGRLDWLKKTPATHRYISYEPVLGPIDADLEGIDLVIAGAETGPRARPCHLDWLRSIRDQCVDAGTHFLLKQINAKGDRELDGRMHEELG